MSTVLDDIDIASHASYANGVPHELLTRLRHEAPVFRHRATADFPTEFWAILRHADVITVSRDPGTYSSAAKGCLTVENRTDLEAARLLIDQDPPEHTRNRARVNKAFTPRALRTLDGHYREVAGEILDAALAKDSFDLVTEVSAELPLVAICEFLGIPRQDRHQIFTWSNTLIGQGDPEYGDDGLASAQAAMAELYMYANELAAQRKIDPRDDIITTLLTAEGADALTEHEFDLFVLLLTVAGNETTRNPISHGILALIEHPASWVALRQDRSLLDPAIEEILRWATPVMQFRRTTMADVELGGQHIAAGDSVVMYYTSANRDEDVFTDPFTFDITRSPNPHLAFGGGGHHFCLGANLARLEMRILFEEILDRVERFELVGEVSRLRSNFVNGIKHLPARAVAR
jgi:cholest-4-en-3-one 26-monooxygenase